MRFVTSVAEMPHEDLLIRRADAGDTFLDAWVSESPQPISTWTEGAFTLRQTREGLSGIASIPCDAVDGGLLQATRGLYLELFRIVDCHPEQQVLRIWNFVPDINGATAAGERYQVFNRGRAEAFETHFGADRAQWIVPAASAVGAPDDSLRVEFFAVPTAPTFLENKAQTPAPRYSRRYGEHAPVFSRGAIFDNQGQRLLVSAGTAAIKGEESLHPGDVLGQFMETIDNLRILTSQANLRRHDVEFGFGLEDLHLLRVYYRRDSDRDALESIVRRVIDPDCRLSFLHADICRADLLVEVEGVFIKKGEYRDARRKCEVVDNRIRVESFELHVAEHCNLRCHMCDAMSPYNKKKLLSLEDVARTLDFIGKHIQADIFKVMGGEPLLHPDLVAILGLVRRSGISETIRMTTNGLLLHKMPDAFWEALDRLTVSNYSSAPLTPERIALIRAKARDFGVVLNLKFIDQFNGVMITTPIDDAARVQRIYDNCWVRHRSLVVRNERFFKCTRAAYLDDFLREFRISKRPDDPDSFHETDGIPLDEHFFENALSYLNSPAPLSSCRYCLGTSGKLMPHRQMSREEVRSRRLEEGSFYSSEPDA